MHILGEREAYGRQRDLLSSRFTVGLVMSPLFPFHCWARYGPGRLLSSTRFTVGLGKRGPGLLFTRFTVGLERRHNEALLPLRTLDMGHNEVLLPPRTLGMRHNEALFASQDPRNEAYWG